MTYDELVEKYNKETLEFHKIDKWHEEGYEGQGVNVLNLEQYSNHGKQTYDMIELVAPRAKIYWCEYGLRNSADKVVSFNAKLGNNLTDVILELNYEQFKDFIKDIDIVTYSRGGSLGKEFEELILDNCITFTSAGNEGSAGLTKAFDGKAIDVGAIHLFNGTIKREVYSSINCDFSFLHGYHEGTSFASPSLAGAVAVIKSNYNNLNRNNCFEVLKHISIDAGEEGHDERFGFGVPILSENYIIDVLEESEVDDEVNRNRHTVRYAHLSEVNVSKGDLVTPKLPWREATLIGKMGNTGMSNGAHLHIDVVDGLVYKLWRLSEMYDGTYFPNKQELDYFVSENDPTLFGVKPVITTDYDEDKYYDIYSKRHLAYDCVPHNRFETNSNFTIYWNRSYGGRVLDTGYDYAYGNYVLIGYTDMRDWIK